MMEFPRFVYKDKGPYERAGGTYDATMVEDEAEHIAAIKAGWFGNLQEAIDSPNVGHVEPIVSGPDHTEPADDAPPTREELEAKATELGIKFDGRIGDKKLTALIAKALEG